MGINWYKFPVEQQIGNVRYFRYSILGEVEKTLFKYLTPI
jgi:hypothetical protein